MHPRFIRISSVAESVQPPRHCAASPPWCDGFSFFVFGCSVISMRVVLLQLYRLGVLLAVVAMVRAHHVRLRIEGDAPVAVGEVTAWFTNAVALQIDAGARGGFHVRAADGAELGYVIRTQPQGNKIVGYCGITDTLVGLDREGRVVGFRIRKSEDTRTHVADVLADRHFRKTWNGMSWEQVAGMDLKAAGVEGVSGATLTSMALAEAVVHRFRVAQGEARAQPWRVRWRDVGLAVAVGVGVWLTFTRRAGRVRWRRWFQWVVVGYVGFVNGDLLAQSLFAGWARAGVPWRLAPGLVLLAAAALVVPWVSGRPLYCQQLCPHGVAQEWLGRVVPARWRVAVPVAWDRGLRWLPGLLLLFVLIVVMLPLDFELAGLEPFDAYLIRVAGGATLAVAVVGLVAAAFVPKAYCRYGCPTGALLEFGRARGAADGFGRREVAAAGLVALAAVMWWKHGWIHAFIYGAAT